MIAYICDECSQFLKREDVCMNWGRPEVYHRKCFHNLFGPDELPLRFICGGCGKPLAILPSDESQWRGTSRVVDTDPQDMLCDECAVTTREEVVSAISNLWGILNE